CKTFHFFVKWRFCSCLFFQIERKKEKENFSKRKNMNKRGFTLIELIVVITTMAILAVVAMPRFMTIVPEARESTRDGVVGAVRSGVSIAYGASLADNGSSASYPATLDAAALGPCVGECFDFVIHDGVNDQKWEKLSDTRYRYEADEVDAATFEYNPNSGTFERIEEE
ncbi:MAG: hypothetical protein CO021_02510, partial [Deltaproteobacteria bacterium CG_4_9_14_0_2_um_filter_42_21]